MSKVKVLFFTNSIVLMACLIELQGDLTEGFTGIKAHHGLAIYAVANIVLHIKELLKARNEFNKTN